MSVNSEIKYALIPYTLFQSAAFNDCEDEVSACLALDHV